MSDENIENTPKNNGNSNNNNQNDANIEPIKRRDSGKIYREKVFYISNITTVN